MNVCTNNSYNTRIGQVWHSAGIYAENSDLEIGAGSTNIYIGSSQNDGPNQNLIIKSGTTTFPGGTYIDAKGNLILGPNCIIQFNTKAGTTSSKNAGKYNMVLSTGNDYINGLTSANQGGREGSLHMYKESGQETGDWWVGQTNGWH